MSENEIKVPDVLEEYFNEVERELELETLNEDVICRFNNLAVTVESDGRTDRGWSNDPYFKIYKQRRSYVARIYINRAEYCKDHDGIPTFKLSSNEKDSLVKLLSDDNFANWKLLLETIVKFIKNPEKVDTNKILNTKMPDYRKL